jgi:hypothetical protein
MWSSFTVLSLLGSIQQGAQPIDFIVVDIVISHQVRNFLFSAASSRARSRLISSSSIS